MTGLKVGGHTVLAADLVEGGASLNATGVPAVAGGLVAEHALADADNAAVMARTAHRTGDGAGELSARQTSAASRALWLGRGKIIDQQQKDVITAIEPVGTAPSAVGLQEWRAWYGPLFLDSMYTHRRKRFNDAWQLPPEYIECVDRNPVVLPDREQVITERQIATVTVANVLKQNLALELGQDRFGNPKPKKPAPDGLDADSFEQLDIVSASLGHLDEALFAEGEREQGGFVHLGKINLYDTFGRPLAWSSDESGLDPLVPWATALPSRLASWGRLGFRLQAAADPDVEATPLTPPVCGILLPDFVDQSLEVYDTNGLAVGQVSADDPVVVNPGGPRVLNATFTPLPWVADALPPGAESTDAITNPTLRRLVQALVAQSVAVPGGASGWFETGFTAMLRVFDTIRSTLDPGFVRGDSRVRLLGEPIVVMNVRLSFEVSAGSIADLRAEPPLLTDPPALPVLRVRVGDVTRPDDGVLGCFLIGASPADDRFAPTSVEAAEKAVVNTMTSLAGSQKTQPISHPFIEAQVAEFDLAAGSPIDTVVLADARGSLYATCGMLPRKTIILPKDFIDPSLKLLEPTFRVGPILGFDQGGTLVPQLPAPTIEGMTATFVHDDDASYPELAVPPVLGVGELPPRRVRLTEGWARMSRQAPPA